MDENFYSGVLVYGLKINIQDIYEICHKSEIDKIKEYDNTKLLLYLDEKIVKKYNMKLISFYDKYSEKVKNPDIDIYQLVIGEKIQNIDLHNLKNIKNKIKHKIHDHVKDDLKKGKLGFYVGIINDN